MSINKTIGDRNRIQQVLMNLLTNSKKFVPRNNGLIEITASTKLNINHFVHLEVEITDNGPGIDPRDYEKLFKPFSKLEST